MSDPIERSITLYIPGQHPDSNPMSHLKSFEGPFTVKLYNTQGVNVSRVFLAGANTNFGNLSALDFGEITTNVPLSVRLAFGDYEEVEGDDNQLYDVWCNQTEQGIMLPEEAHRAIEISTLTVIPHLPV